MRKKRNVVALAVLGLLAASAVLRAGFDVPLDWMARADAIVADEKLSVAQKLARLSDVFPDDLPVSDRAYWLHRVDADVVRRRLLAVFRDEEARLSERLLVARRILQPQGLFSDSPAVRDAFFAEFHPWLVEQVVRSRRRMLEPMPHSWHRLTPVEELAFMAGGFNGWPSEMFKPFETELRLIPVLIEALRMPDDLPVNGHGGQGRNLRRELVPVALARLEAEDAIPTLLNVLKAHHDWYLRRNAAYALGVLLPADRRDEVIPLLGRKREPSPRMPIGSHHFAFGRGMVDGGDDAGLVYFAPRYAAASTDATYMLGRRLDALEGVRSPKVAGLVRLLLEHEPVWAALVSNQSDYLIKKRCDRLCELIEDNQAIESITLLQRLAGAAQNPVVRERLETCIDRLKAGR